MKKILTRSARLIALSVPMILGMIGFVWVEGEPFSHSLFTSICMYLMNYQDLPPNLWVEFARWTAPLATASGVILAIHTLHRKLHNFFRWCTGKAAAVYGPEEEKQSILRQLGSRAIDGGSEFVRAQTYFLLHDEAWNLDFYSRNREELKDAAVYLKCRNLRSQSMADPRLRLYCPEETAARLYWKERCLYETSAANRHRMQIVFLGFGKLGEELLTAGLQNNIFHPDQHLEYHVFADGAAFTTKYTELGSIGDPVIFHSEPWHDCRSLIEQAQLVVVLEQTEQPALLQSLLFTTVRRSFDVFAAAPEVLPLLEQYDRLRAFDWQKEAGQLAHIQGDLLQRRAKKINLRYMSLYENVPETEENLELQWRRLNAFTRYSNISAADYHDVRLQMMRALGIAEDVSRLAAGDMELLTELEHIRWCRYHYLNNWRYGVPRDGRRKDPEQRIHTDLIPYSALTEGDKEKDRENIRILLDIR